MSFKEASDFPSEAKEYFRKIEDIFGTDNILEQFDQRSMTVWDAEETFHYYMKTDLPNVALDFWGITSMWGHKMIRFKVSVVTKESSFWDYYNSEED